MNNTLAGLVGWPDERVATLENKSIPNGLSLMINSDANLLSRFIGQKSEQLISVQPIYSNSVQVTGHMNRY